MGTSGEIVACSTEAHNGQSLLHLRNFYGTGLRRMSQTVVDTPPGDGKNVAKPNTVSYPEWLRVGPKDATATAPKSFER